MNLAVVPPGRQELEALSLAERVALEDAFGEAHDLIRSLNDEEIGRLCAGGASLSALAEMTGLTKQGVAKRLDRLDLQTLGQAKAAEGSTSSPPLPQNGDGPDAPEPVDAEVVEDDPDRPEQFYPDVVSNEADRDLRTQALHWFSQGRHLDELLEGGATVEPRSRDDKAAIKREAAEMVRIARRLKGAF